MAAQKNTMNKTELKHSYKDLSLSK